MNSRKRFSKQSSGRRRGRGPKKKRIDPKKFWGDSKLVSELASEQQLAKMASKPSAVVQSLGRVPLSWPQEATDEKLAEIYDRASMLAGALAAAGDLIEMEDLDR